MATALWVGLGIVAVAAVGWLLAVRMRKSPFTFSSGTSSPELAGPHWPERGLLPERYATREVIEATGTRAVGGLSKTEAEELLDWLEANGVQNRELVCADEQGFTVRYW
jgi:hypothetical protein